MQAHKLVCLADDFMPNLSLPTVCHRMKPGFRMSLVIVLLAMMGGCTQTSVPLNMLTQTVPSVTTSTKQPEPTETALHVTKTLQPTSTTLSTIQICSPLEGFSIEEVNTIRTNPVKPPLPGKDDGHHGIDFSFWTYGDWKTMAGLGIHTVLDGIVAGTVNDRFPYGYMIMIETPFEQLPTELRFQLESISPAPLPDLTNSALSCPDINPSDFITNSKSLYLVYAHMLEMPVLQLNESVQCGSTIGKVGNTGDSSNPHLHFEARIGPSGYRFTDMAHYLNDASELERYNYCTWRVSGVFQLIDPQLVLDAGLIQ